MVWVWGLIPLSSNVEASASDGTQGMVALPGKAALTPSPKQQPGATGHNGDGKGLCGLNTLAWTQSR